MFYLGSGVLTDRKPRSTRFVFTLHMMLPLSLGRHLPKKLPVMTRFLIRMKRVGKKGARTVGIFLLVQLEPMGAGVLKPNTVVMLFTGT